MGSVVSKCAFLPPPPTYTNLLPGLIMVKNKIPLVYVEAKASQSAYTIVFTHGNASDMGEMVDWMEYLSTNLMVNMAVYDYQGYGLNVGDPSEKACYQDIEEVCEWICETKLVPRHRIILMGQSLGSGPTTHIAAKMCKTFPPAGVVLVSPLVSAIRVVSDTLSYLPFDIFENGKKLPKVTCPVFIVHGTEDEVVPFDHGQVLSKKAPHLWKFLDIKGAGHNNIECDHHEVFVRDMQEFIKYLRWRRDSPRPSTSTDGTT